MHGYVVQDRAGIRTGQKLLRSDTSPPWMDGKLRIPMPSEAEKILRIREADAADQIVEPTISRRGQCAVEI